MASDLSEFRWHVATAGYEWEERKSAKYLMPIPVDGHRIYDPLDEPALFRTFAATPATEEGIISFANRFGTLTSSLFGERLTDWQWAISGMQRAMKLWSAIENADEELTKLVTWTGDRPGARTVKYDDGFTRLRFKEGLVAHGEVFDPARLALHRIVNKQLTDVGPRLLLDLKPKSVLKTVPGNLIVCLWLQLAESIDGNKQQRQCPACGRFFEVGRAAPGKGHGRSDKRACSVGCRYRLYRHRQEQARQMKARGKRIEKIAEELGSDVATVKNWLKQKKG